MELFGEDSGVMTDGTQPPRGLVGVWELPEGGGRSVQHVSKGCGRLWPWVLQLHARATWRDFDSTGQHHTCSCHSTFL